ncbi:hypothetical protein F4561_001725 [Lipingzhangella halophila]|uniref:Uncharacterized protein n=1 Tax=Lipingzhangella halophila TaxID=1783352 RepID=A0A7W7RFH5_9ACTN|nr:hypothetical protein [Lipingzhangella halophila]MBB4930905.1 hypothetical protein [Lipingzhangella halophila]
MVGGHRKKTWTAVTSAVVLAAVAACGGPAASEPSSSTRGTEWSAVLGAPDLGGSFSALAATDSANIWAFGDTDAQVDGTTWVYHWDGSDWTRQETPDDWALVPSTADATGPDDVWAAGESPGGGAGVIHYDGTEWSESDQSGFRPSAIEALAADDVWLLGAAGEEAARFDGASWSDADSPRVGTALSGTGSDALFAVGTLDRQPAADMWNGEEWVSMDVPEVDLSVGGEASASFDDVYAHSADDVWAVGDLHYKDSDETNNHRPLTAHWDGTEWEVTVEEHAGSYAAVTGDGAGGLWIEKSAWNPVMLHRAADGTVTEFELAGEDYDYSVPALEHVPGTTAAVAAGTAHVKGDPEEITDHGRIFTTGM